MRTEVEMLDIPEEPEPSDETQAEWAKEIRALLAKQDEKEEVEVSIERLQQIKERIDNSGVVLLTASPQSGKTFFGRMLKTYLTSLGYKVLFNTVSTIQWLDSDGEDEVRRCVRDVVRRSGMSLEDILSYSCDQKRMYFILDEIQAVVGRAEYFWKVIKDLAEKKSVGILLLSTYIPPNKICQWITDKTQSDVFFMLNEQEVFDLFKRQDITLTQHQVEVLHRITSGHPNLLESMTRSGDYNFSSQDAFFTFVTSPGIRETICMQAAMESSYGHLADMFLDEMLLGIDAKGIYDYKSSGADMINTTKAIEKLLSHGVICQVEGGVKFTVELYRIVLGHARFGIPRNLSILGNWYPGGFEEMITTCLHHLTPSRIRECAQTLDSEKGRRNLLQRFYSSAADAAQGFCRVVPFTGSVFGSFGYALDIKFDGAVNWGVDIMLGDLSRPPSHIQLFLDGTNRQMEQGAVLLFTTNPPQPSAMKENVWYIACEDGHWQTAFIIRKDCEAITVSFGCDSQLCSICHPYRGLWE